MSQYLVKMCKQQIISPISIDCYLNAISRKAADFDKQTKTARSMAQRKLDDDAVRKYRSLRVKVSEPQIENNKLMRNLQRDGDSYMRHVEMPLITYLPFSFLFSKQWKSKHRK